MNNPTKNLPLLLNLAWGVYNLGLLPAGTDGSLAPQTIDGNMTTHCNQAMQEILLGFGYTGMTGLTADAMIMYMQNPANGWTTGISDQTAQYHANDGAIVFAGWSNPSGHGHVNLILPGILQTSPSAGKPVPCCLNIGKDVFMGKRLSWAFAYPTETPTYFVLSSMV